MQFEIWKGFPKSENIIDENGERWAIGAIYPMCIGTYEGKPSKRHVWFVGTKDV